METKLHRVRQENPEVANFCLACGKALALAAASATPPQADEERKLISLVFNERSTL